MSYLIFSGLHQPNGGWSDFDCRKEHYCDAINYVGDIPCDWWQIVNTETLEIENEGHKR